MGDKKKGVNAVVHQTTLFSTWGSSVGPNLTGSSSGNERSLLNKLESVSDEVLASIMALQQDDDFDNEMSEATGVGQDKKQLNEFGSMRERPREVIDGFDEKEGAIWIYPVNYPLRDYQYNIVQKALFNNTLVSLPTGLGKTFIAAVVMFNFYRWYPKRKIVFMAPSKPLVAQQIEACFKVMGIPQSDMCEMTGHMQPIRRESEWQNKRVFFLTPQVVQNDLGRGSCSAVDIVCVVVDEAHRALGNHAYCQVMRELANFTTNFRVLALSATPGDNVKMVQNVVTNLMISHVELRSEESLDLQPYIHKRKEEKVVVKLGEELTRLKDRFLEIVAVSIKRLVSNGALYSSSLESYGKFILLKARDEFHRRLSTNPTQSRGVIEGDFAMSITLYHAYELLLQHGMRSFYQFLKSTMDGSKGQSRARAELAGNSTFHEIMDELKEKFDVEGISCVSPSKFMSATQRGGRSRLLSSYGATEAKPEAVKDLVCSHPKLKVLRKIVLDHFNQVDGAKIGGLGSRVMIFSQYRESVHEIADVLSVHSPTIRVMTFVGQASTGKSSRGLTQKEQLQVVQKFRQGGYNTLVATCVGEEGLDIGEVDLIVCFDAHASPVRLVQRLGRTGRKRDGRIVVLVTEGKEEKTLKRSEASRKGIHKAIRDAVRSFNLYPHNPRMVPFHIQPQAHQMHMTPGDYIDRHEQKRQKQKGQNRTICYRNSTNIKQCFSKWGKKGELGLLTDGELCYWSENFMLPQDECDKLSYITEDVFSSTRPFISLSKKSVAIESTEQTMSLTLSRQSDSQMTPSPVYLIGHSLRCHKLIELAQFADMCKDRDEDDDTYCLEMMTYLNDDDVSTVTKKPYVDSNLKKSDDLDKRNVASDSDDSVLLVAKQKRKKARSVFPDDEDDFVQCLQDRRLSDSSEDESELPAALNRSSTKKEVSTSVVEPRHKNSLLSSDLIFDTLLPSPSQFSSKVSHVPLTIKSIIREAPTFDDTFGGLLSQISRSEVIHKDDNLSKCSDSRNEFGHAHPADTFSVQTTEELATMDNMSDGGFSTSIHDTNATDTNTGKNMRNGDISISESLSTKFSTETITACEVSEDLCKVHKAREQPVAQNVRRCAAYRLQRFQFGKKMNEGHPSVSSSPVSTALSVVATEQTVIPDSAPEDGSDKEENTIDAIKRTKRTYKKLNVLRSPNVYLANGDKQQERTQGGAESDDDFETQINKPLKEAQSSVNTNMTMKSSSINLQKPQSDVKAKDKRIDFFRNGLKTRAQKKLKKHFEKAKTKHVGREFLDEEAELSSDNACVVSSDEDVEDNTDGYIADSFIDDHTQTAEYHHFQVTYEKSESPVDMQAVYRRSLMSPSCQRGTYKLVFGHHHNRHRLQYSDSELESSFIDDREVNEVSSSQAEEDNRFIVSEGDGSEDIECTVKERDKETDSVELESPSFISTKVKGKRRRRAVLEESSEQDSVVADEPTKKSPKVSCVATSSSVLFSGERNRQQFPGKQILNNVNQNGTLLTSSPQPAHIESTASHVEIEIPQFDMFDDDLDEQLQQLDEQTLSQELVKPAEVIHPFAPLVISPIAKTKSPNMINQSCTRSAQCVLPPDPEMNAISTSVQASQMSATHTVSKGTKMKILVDTREVSTATQTVSALRLNHLIDPVVCSLSHCDYIVSNRMGVKKVHQSSLSTSSKSSKAVDSLRHMFSLFERPCLIIEKEREKSREAKRPHNRTHHFNNSLAALAQTHAKVLFSDSQVMTAAFIIDLTVSEQEKQASIDATCDIAKGTNDPVLKILLSIPCLSFISALNLFRSFTSLEEICRSSPSELVRRTASLSSQRAKTLVSYLQHNFDIDMIPK